MVLVVTKASKYDGFTVRVDLFVKTSFTPGVGSAEQSCSLLPHVYSGVFYDLSVGSSLYRNCGSRVGVVTRLQAGDCGIVV